jgi:hypothetical protein
MSAAVLTSASLTKVRSVFRLASIRSCCHSSAGLFAASSAC